MNVEETKEETLKAIGALEEATESLEETTEDCHEEEEAILYGLDWFVRVLKVIFQKTIE